MSTERLYYTDCYQAVFDATVLQISDGGRSVMLDRTAFYPLSGGQPRDFGSLEGIEVADVTEGEGDLVHRLAKPLAAAAGQTIRGEIDWTRRYDHMQQHTGQHLLSAVFAEVLGLPTLSFHMGAAVSTIELNAPAVDGASLAQVEERVNQLVWNALPVNISFEEAAEAQDLRKASEREGTLRIVKIAGVDRSACGGTHVQNTSEIGPVHIRGSEKVRGNVRLAFVCGGRALRQSRRDFEQLSAVSRALGVPFESAAEAAARMRERLNDTERSAKKLAAEAATREGETLYAQTAPDASGRRSTVLRREIDDAARQWATAFVSAGRAAAIVWWDDSRSVLLAVSPDYGVHAGSTLKDLLTQYGGKGGGSATMAQGTLPTDVDIRAGVADLERRLMEGTVRTP